jgi:protein associated with RNAse G/E
MRITVRLIKPAKDKVVTYRGELLERTDTMILLYAQWGLGLMDLGYVAFEPGDYLYEYFYSDRWYNVYELHEPEGQLKGWYCNITRPAIFGTDSIESEDLELDLFVSPGRRTIILLDEDEYNARDLPTTDPEAHAAAQGAVAELKDLARRGEGPFRMGAARSREA